MAYKGNEIAMGNLAPSLKEFLESMGGGGDYKEVPVNESSVLPLDYEEGYTFFVIRPYTTEHAGWKTLIAGGNSQSFLVETFRKDKTVTQKICVFNTSNVREEASGPYTAFQSNMSYAYQRSGIPATIPGSVYAGYYTWGNRTQIFPVITTIPTKSNQISTHELSFSLSTGTAKTIGPNLAIPVAFNYSTRTFGTRSISDIIFGTSNGDFTEMTVLECNTYSYPVQFTMVMHLDSTTMNNVEVAMAVFSNSTHAANNDFNYIEEYYTTVCNNSNHKSIMSVLNNNDNSYRGTFVFPPYGGNTDATMYIKFYVAGDASIAVKFYPRLYITCYGGSTI